MDYLSLALGIMSIVATLAVAIASTIQVRKVSQALTRKINNIEEVTRKPLTDFPSVYKMALKMVNDLREAESKPGHDSKHPEDFIWILNYTPCFGLVHSYNVEYKEVAAFRDDPDVQRMVTRPLGFTGELEALSKIARNFRLVTVDPSDAAATFFEPILNKFRSETQKEDILDVVVKQHRQAVENLKGTLVANNSIGEVRFIPEVRTQMFLARIEGEPRCLVFSTMGTDPTGASKGKHYVRGFYTQLEHIAEFYCDRFSEVYEAAKPSASSTVGPVL